MDEAHHKQFVEAMSRATARDGQMAAYTGIVRSIVNPDVWMLITRRAVELAVIGDANARDWLTEILFHGE